MIKKYFTRRRIKNAVLFLRTHGIKLFVREVLKDVLQKPWLFSTRRYKIWIKQNEPSQEQLVEQKSVCFGYQPKISIVVPVYNTPFFFLRKMLDSVLNQTYSNWELCIADGGSSTPGFQKMLIDQGKKETRIKIKLLEENKGIAGNSNEALSLATGDYIAFLDHDDTLAPFALFEIVKAINESPDADFIYSDEDLISENGKTRFMPHFKPDWSPDLLRSCNYITHLTVIKRELLSKTGWFREGFEGSQDYDLILRATESARKITHIPKVLYHWRINDNSCAGKPHVKPYAFESAKKALSEHLARTNMEGRVEDGAFLGIYKITFRIDNPRVSIIIPNRDHADDLNACIKSILNKSFYRNSEIIIVENGSVEDGTIKVYDELGKLDYIRIINWEKPFNYSVVNNHAARLADGEVLLFLNNDTEIISHDWIEKMLEYAVRKDVGAVGAKLCYRDNTIQHAGIILGTGGRVLHAHRFYPVDSTGYRGRLKMAHNVSALTGACLMVRKNVFEEVNGFDEGYTITFGDIDLCMKIRSAGYVNVWTPFAELYHDELATRGSDAIPANKERFLREQSYFLKKWGSTIQRGDPFYSLNLTQEYEDFSISP